MGYSFPPAQFLTGPAAPILLFGDFKEYFIKTFEHACLTLGYIIAGCPITATGLVMFTITNHIAPGGSSGLATSLAVAVPLSVGILTWMVNIPILFASIRGGKRPFAPNIIAYKYK